MIQNRLVQLLLLPFSLLYGLGISLRNLMYDIGILRSTRFNIPVISVGNLSIGGTGKTPHIEYLIRSLSKHINIATLSRGYKRKTKGFRFVLPSNTVFEVGDEALVYRRKYTDLVVAVSESREVGIPQILQHHPDVDLVLLDDAFQHRSIDPGLNILLTEYDRPFVYDFLLPAGRLREWKSSYKRADILIITKCPPQLSLEEQKEAVKAVKPLDHQRIYFSYFDYGEPYFLFNPYSRLKLNSDTEIMLVSAIAHTEYLMSYLSSLDAEVQPVFFEDHHYFTNLDMSQLKIAFDRMKGENKIILSTEKDAVRFAEHRNFILESQLPVFILPVEIRFHFEQQADFDRDVKQFLLNFKV